MGTSELNDAIRGIAYIGLDMFELSMFILHNFQQDVVEEIKTQEHTTYN